MCKICGNVPCTCYSLYCDPCAPKECINERLECVVYRLDNTTVNHLSCLGLPNNITLEYFFEKLDERVCRILNLQAPIIPVDTFSVDLTVSGIVNHVLKADVRIATLSDNGIVINPDGLFAPLEDGKIKVDSSDTKDYLVDQVDGGTDGIVNVAVYAETELLHVQPSIDVSALLDKIRTDYLSRFCEIVALCGPDPSFIIQAIGLSSIGNTTLGDPSSIINSDGDFSVDWGDGTVEDFAAGSHSLGHIYATPFTGQIVVSSPDLANITALAVGGGVNGGISPIYTSMSILTTEISKLTSLVYIGMGEAIFVDGVVSDLPQVLQTIVIANTNLSGLTSEFSANTTYIYILGVNTIGGNVSFLPPNLYFFELMGNNTVFGDVAGFPRSVTNIYLEGYNTISGNLNGLPPNLVALEVKGSNTLTGDINGAPKSIYDTFNVIGQNTISGNIGNCPPNLTNIIVNGYNTLTGNVGTLPSVMTSLQFLGNSTVSGDLANLPAGTIVINIIGAGASLTYTGGRVWANNMNQVNILPSASGLTTLMVDNLIIDLANVPTWIDYHQLVIAGASQGRSAASNAAVAVLLSKGVTVETA